MQLRKRKEIYNYFLGIFKEIISHHVINESIISFSLYQMMFFVVDISLLLKNNDFQEYIIGKLIIHFLLFTVIVYQRKKLKRIYVFIIMLFTQAFQIIIIYILGRDYLLIVLLVFEEHQITKIHFENIILRIIQKIFYLIMVINLQDHVAITVISCVLFLELIKYFYFVLFQNDLQNIEVIQQQKIIHEISHPIFSKQSTLIRQNSNLPSSYALISIKDQIITFKNQSFSKLFSQICQKDEDYDDLILKQMKYYIIKENIEDQNKISTQQHIFKNRFNFQKCFSSKNDTDQQGSENSQTLLEIFHKYVGIEDSGTKVLCKTLDFYCKYNFDPNFIIQDISYKTYTGQIIINYDEDEIILTLVDITKQNQVQEEIIKDQFQLSIIQSFSHELRTPLNSSLNFLQYCENEPTISDEIKNNLISPAINALRLQSYLINDIIDFNSLCSQNFELDVDIVSIESIVNEINKLFKSVLQMKNLALFIDLRQNELPYICTDFSRLIQIITNVLQNSIKFSNSGSIVLKLVQESSNCIKIIVKDEGIGMDNETIKDLNAYLSKIKGIQYFSEISVWHGFGLLISSLLLQRLGPENQNSFIIQSNGLQQGTKVTFFIQNQQITNQVSNVQMKEQIIKTQGKNGGSIHLGSKSNLTPYMNGTILQISDIDLFHYKKKIQIENHISKSSSHESLNIYQHSIQNSLNSLNDVDFELEVGKFQNLNPILFSEQAVSIRRNIKRNQSSKFNEQTKIVDYSSIQQQEELENETLLKRVFKKMSCKCRKILAVDDEIFNQKSIQFLLKQHGFEAFNGQEALKIAVDMKKCSQNCSQILLILMDYQMPFMNGLQTTVALKKLMEQNIIPKIHIIGLTAFNSRKDIDQCLKSGMSAVLTKPLKIQEFFEILKYL